MSKPKGIKISDKVVFMFDGNNLYVQPPHKFWYMIRLNRTIIKEKKQVYKLLKDIISKI